MGLDTSLPLAGEGEPVALLARLAAAARLVACFAALSLMLQRHPPPGATLALPLLFAAYGGALYWRAVAYPTAKEGASFYAIDALWFLALILATGGPRSPFVLFLLFPILFVSFRSGFAPGMAMAVLSAILLPFSALPIGHLGSKLMTGSLLFSALAPSAALLVSGYLIATWAASGLALNRRLSVLRALNAECGPRLTPEQMVDVSVRRLADLFPIDAYCLLVEEAGRPPRLSASSLTQESPFASAGTFTVPVRELLPQLQRLGAPLAWRQRGRWRGWGSARLLGLSGLDAQLLRGHQEQAAAVGQALGCLSFCAVTTSLREGVQARLFLISQRSRFNVDDLAFFQQMAQQLGPRLASASLLDHLAQQVADYERQKISRDMHDSAIQPYIGLKFALEALARRAPAADPVAAELGKLVHMANTEIAELRRYVKNLRGEGERGHAALVPAIKRQAARFAELYGIHIVVHAPDDLAIGDELAEDVFHMIGEALSNIRRHTDATRARIELDCDGKSFLFRVSNPSAATFPATFTPRSISERASSLGGTCRVGRGAAGETEVVVEVPLDQGEREAFAA